MRSPFAALVFSLPLFFACAQNIQVAQDAAGDDSGGSGEDAPSLDASVPDAPPSDTFRGDLHDEPPDAGREDARARDAGFDAGPTGDAGFRPNAPCRPLVLDCLELTPDVIEVPTQMTIAQAFQSARANQTIQLRGIAVSNAGLTLPPFVTVHGCQGAVLTSHIAFAGEGAVIEGMIISGALIAHRTGNYVVRYNRFRGDTVGGGEPGVAARSTDALLSARISMLVDSNSFDDRWPGTGISAITQYDTMTHEVTITIRNNVFNHVFRPIIVSEGGLVGVISARIEHNTFFDFGDAMTLSGRHIVTTFGNLYSDGQLAVRSSVVFEAFYSMTARITTPGAVYTGTLVNGAFASAPNLGFVDPTHSDFRLTAESPAVDQIPSAEHLPSPDYYGCPRPVPLLRSDPSGDIGALEAQPAR